MINSKTDLNVYVHIFRGKGLAQYYDRYQRGLEPDASPYGLHNASSDQVKVSFSRDADKRNLLAKILNKVLGFDLLHAFYNRAAISRSHVVWTMTENEAFAVAALFRLRFLKKRPIVANAIWLFNEWSSRPAWLRALYISLSKDVTLMTVHSEQCLQEIKKTFPKLKSELSYFGVNDQTFQQVYANPVSDSYKQRLVIFSAGNDKTRDWDTLLNAFGNDARFTLVIACAWLDPRLQDRYENLTLLKVANMQDFISAYSRSDFVVIPMVKNLYSGITVALEAACMGKAMISTNTGGVPTYFDDSEVIYVEPKDSVAMREAALNSTSASRTFLGELAKKRFLNSNYTTKAMAQRYIHLTEYILNLA